MRLLHSRNSWHYSMGGQPTVDFCLWILQVDGLRVPPFDQHPDGDGSLRAVGLTAEDWQSWLLRVCNHEQNEREAQDYQKRILEEYLKVPVDFTESEKQRFGEHLRAEFIEATKDGKELSESDK